jgi:hypothetical protein
MHGATVKIIFDDFWYWNNNTNNKPQNYTWSILYTYFYVTEEIILNYY